MHRRAKTRLAGTIAAIPLWVLSCGVATSQSTVVNDQVQLGDIFSGQTLDVVTADDTTAVTTATANSLTGSVQSGDVDVQSTQSDQGAVTAQTTVNVASYAGATLAATTAATGDTTDADIAGGGRMTGSFLQTVGAVGITAESQVNAADGQTDVANVAVQAIANSAGFGATDSEVDVSTSQSSSASTQANGGAVIGFHSGDGGFSAAAVGDNLSAVGAGQSSLTLDSTQSNDGDLVQATYFTAFGNSQNTATSATATANNLNATNEGGDLSVTTDQSNDSYVRAQAEESSYEFGGANVSAYGAGNSVLAGEIGPNVALDNVQFNGDGGVESLASFSGDHGYDGFVSSTAMGNAATGFACSDCLGGMTVRNSQTNTGDVAASSSLAFTGSARSARGTATAVGNNASFYTTVPTH